ncbi:MAG: FAD-dependent oxidoreductase [Proteobacteria bacterium]|nr:FAD-dependent oxidoreductase [Pseudomonadota bacterium]
MKSHTQVAVIGGGIIGCSILYHLARMGWRDVVLLERRDLTAGSTWHAAASTHRMHGTPNIAKLQSYSNQLYAELEEETGQSCGIHKAGGLYLASSQARMDELRIQSGRAKYLGFDFSLVTPEEIKSLNPLVETKGLFGGMYDPEDGHVDPSGVPLALAKGARLRGATIYRQTEVLETTQTTGGGWNIVTSQGTIKADVIVNAAGLWGREVAALAGVYLPLVPMEHQYVVTDSVQAVAELPHEMPLTRDYDYEFYMRQEGEGLLLGAYEKQGRHWAVDGTPLDFGQELLPEDLERIEPNLMQAMSRIPCMAEAGIRRVINGPMVFSPDGLPMIGPVPGLKNYFVAAAVMAGFSQGGGLGRVLAEWIVEGEPSMDLFSLDVARFGEYATRDYTLAKTADNYSRRFAIHYPFEERKAGRPARTSPIYDQLKHRGAVMGAVYGLERPLWFAPEGVIAEDELSFKRSNWFSHVGRECRALRQGVALMDLSVFGKLEVSGSDSEKFLNRVFAGKLPRAPGSMAICPMLNRHGGIIGDYTINRIDDEQFYLIGASTAEKYHLRWFEEHRNGDRVGIKTVAAENGVFGIAGPRSRELLSRLSNVPVDNSRFPFFTFRDMELGPVPMARVMRVSFTGDLGYEIHFPMAFQKTLFEALLKQGEDLGLSLAGGRALDSLRLEKSYPRWGLELSGDTTPVEAGMMFFVDMDKDFVGKNAVLARKQEKPSSKLVTLTVDAADADALGNEPVLSNGRVVGVTTSGGYGHFVEKSIALAYVEPEFAKPDAMLEIEIIGDLRRAHVQARPLFDPKGLILRS